MRVSKTKLLLKFAFSLLNKTGIRKALYDRVGFNFEEVLLTLAEQEDPEVIAELAGIPKELLDDVLENPEKLINNVFPKYA